MILTAVLLFASIFHHKPKEKPVHIPTPFELRLKEADAYFDAAQKGIMAYEEDSQYAQYERLELDRFEQQFRKAAEERESDPITFEQDMHILDEYGQALDSVDHFLHHERAI